VYIGYWIYSVGFIALALAPNGWILCAIMAPFALSGMAGPALNSIMSAQMPPDAQGELQGAITSLQSFTAIFAPVLMTQLFKAFTETDRFYFPGAPYFVAGVFSLLSLAIVTLVLRSHGARVPTRTPDRAAPVN
jgi:DHA1 family tetracycline resistance protein-like MFS transporter